MKQQLMQAAKTIAKQMNYNLNDFDTSPEKLEEGFALIRPDVNLFTEVCQANQLKPISTELVIMCLKPEFAKGCRYSLPHQHAKKSLTAVVPLSAGGTFLPTKDNANVLKLETGPCFIEGNKPHAFGMLEDAPFIAALAVVNLEQDSAPIRIAEQQYETNMLIVEDYSTRMITLAN